MYGNNKLTFQLNILLCIMSRNQRKISYIFMTVIEQHSLVQVCATYSLQTSCFDWLTQIFRQVFLPQGYPESVSDDYYEYQLWDTMQAFCSTISGTLTTQAIMKGVGVGDSTATPLSAAITWILKDGTGMMGRIIFAWFEGTRLDGDCKKWRLFADILNDLAMTLELMVPMFINYATGILCITTTMKAIVGVAGGATRAAITQHQAIRNNMADVSAKDGSQETFVNLIASLVGIFILSTFNEGRLVWELFMAFTLVHLFANYMAVRALKMTTLNNTRLNLLFFTYLSQGTILTPQAVNLQESVILGTGISDRTLCGFRIKMGVSLQNILKRKHITSDDLKLLANMFRNRKYLIVQDMKNKIIFVSLAENESATDVIVAYCHALLLGVGTSMVECAPLEVLKNLHSSPEVPVVHLQQTILNLKQSSNKDSTRMRMFVEVFLAAEEIIENDLPAFISSIQKTGWRTNSHHLNVDEWRWCWKTTGEEINFIH